MPTDDHDDEPDSAYRAGLERARAALAEAIRRTTTDQEHPDTEGSAA